LSVLSIFNRGGVTPNSKLHCLHLRVGLAQNQSCARPFTIKSALLLFKKGTDMQLHKRLTLDQVQLILAWYEQGLMTTTEARTRLGVKRRRFFVLLKARRDGQLNSLAPQRTNKHRKIPASIERVIRDELEQDKRLIDEPSLPVTTYNYRAIRDEVVTQTGRHISAQTVRNRAKAWGYYVPKPAPKAKHTRVVLTTATGLLLQHDASHHKWSPHADRKWCLITTIDDYSRLLLFAELFEEESAWAHIQALKQVVLTYGVGCNYYTDNHSIFRYIERMESYWQTPKISTKDIKTQWERAVKECGMDSIWALSPEAKGKVERPYRWLQDRIVRQCAKAQVSTIEAAQAILQAEVERYNTKQVHSTTGEIPLVRFKRAKREGNTVFRPFALPKPFTSAKDVFCLKEERVVNGYSSVAWRNHYWKVPRSVPEGTKVTLHIVPDNTHPELRIWHKDELVTAIMLEPTNRKPQLN